MKWMQRNKSRIAALFMALVLVESTAAPALAAGTEMSGDTVCISTAQDLVTLARHCALDTWSQGKTVVLQADISLADVEFTPIPTFGGTFDGGGHTISGLDMDGSVCPAGLFGVVQQGGVVKDLTVRGSVVPSGDADTLGGIVGVNHGRLTGCAFQGYVSGSNRVGGIVGLNETTGQLINCSFRGAVTGEHYVGGIAGQNLGSLIQCVNNGSVNTTEIDVEASLLDLDLTSYRLNSTENMPAGTDIGGVAGFSAGVMQNCRNTGDVGYEHMGYNVGGIVGRHSGYLDGCVNRGTVRGRKDVGGIAGQLEPQVTLKYGGDTLSELWDELDVLESLMDQTLNDADGVSDSILDRMNSLTDSVGAAKDTTVDLSDAMTDWANANIDQVNDASARLSWVLGQMEPVMDDISDALKQAKTAVSQFTDALDELEDAGELSSDAVAQLRLAMEDLRTASQKGGDAFVCVRSAMTHLQNSLGDREKIEQALEELSGGLSDLSGAFSEIAAAVVRISAVLDRAEEWVETDPAWAQLRQGITELRSALQEISAAVDDVRSAVRRILQLDATEENLALLSAAVGRLGAAVTDLSRACSDFAAALDAFSAGDTEGVQSQLDQGMEELERAGGEIAAAGEQLTSIVKNAAAGLAELPTALRDLKNGLARLNDGIAAADAAAEKIGGAVEQLRQSDVPRETIDALQTERSNISKVLEDARNAADRIDAALTALKNELDPSEAEAAWQDLQSAADAAEDCARALDRAGGHLEQVLKDAEEAGPYLSAAAEHMSKAGRAMEKAIALLRQATVQAADIIAELAEKPAIQFRPLGSEVTERGDALDGALTQLLDHMNALQDTMSASSDVLLADLRAINRQMGVITDLLRQAGQEAKEEKESDRFEDISDRELYEDRTSGRISNARNAGTVEGDVNVAGVVGSMAIEYDFDPEDDLTESGDRSLDFRYQAVAVVLGSVNEGVVRAKKDCAGGIVGRMDLGTVYACEGYGSVESTGGDYVGGIAGLSRAAIRESYAKCTLSGGSYVGGILGAGDEGSVTEGCCTLVRITDCEQYGGAISGSEEGEFQGNRFVSDELAGLGRVSYAGKAEPVSYEALMEVEGLPAPFHSFTLVFTALDEVLTRLSFSFGASFGPDVYPALPQKEGCYAQWDVQDLSDLRFDTVVTAVYTPYITALSTETVRENGRPVFYVEGSFRQGDSVEAQALATEDADLNDIAQPVFQKRQLAELWRVTFSDDGQSEHTLRYLRGEGRKRIQVYIRQNGTWQQVEGEEIGQYLAFQAEGSEVEIAVFSMSLTWQVWALLALVLLAVLGAVRAVKKSRKRRRKPVAVK